MRWHLLGISRMPDAPGDDLGERPRSPHSAFVFHVDWLHWLANTCSRTGSRILVHTAKAHFQEERKELVKQGLTVRPDAVSKLWTSGVSRPHHCFVTSGLRTSWATWDSATRAFCGFKAEDRTLRNVRKSRKAFQREGCSQRPVGKHFLFIGNWERTFRFEGE